jgi:hypothetical protein
MPRSGWIWSRGVERKSRRSARRLGGAANYDLVIVGGDHRRALMLPGTAVAVIIFERCGVTVERVSGQPFGTSESQRPFDVDLREGS